MGEIKKLVGHVIEPTDQQSSQINEQEPKWKLSTGQTWSSTDDQESEITQLPISSKDDYYELIKQSLFWIDMNLMGDTNNWSLLQKEWVIKAYGSGLTTNQEKLIQKLFNIINGFDSRDTSTLQQFLQQNKDNLDLKTVLNLQVGASELALLHILPTILELNPRDRRTLMDYLLKAGSDPNIQNYEGKTPLHYYAAAYPVEKEYVDSLVSYGADLNIKDNNGKTPLQIAIDKGTLDVAECFFTPEQKKLYEELNKLIEATSKFENGFSQYNVQGVEDLKKFLNEHKNNKDLKMILSIRDEENNLEILKDYMYTEVIDLLSSAALQAMVTGQETEENYVPHQCLFDIYLPYQLRQLNKFVSEISKTANIVELQKVIDKAIMSGVRLNLAEDQGQYFTDYVLERIDQLEGNYGVASNIVCTLISKGARIRTWDSLDVIDKIERECKDHKANMIKAHEQYLNCTQKFLKIAKNATNGKLNCAKMDNATFYLEYSEDSTIDIAQITDGTRDLGLTHGDVKCGRNIVKIGNSEVEIKTEDGIRNYTDLTEGSSIVLTFYTSLGNIDVRLYPDVQDKSKIIVEVSNKEEVLEKFEGHEEELGEDCELGNCCVYDAIEQGYFKRSGKLMRPEVISESNNKWAEHEESRRDSREEIARRHKLLQDLRNIESNIVKKEKNFNIKTHLVDIFKTLSRFYEEKGDISKTDLANTAEKESKRLGLEGRYNWNELFSLEKKVPQNIEQKLPLSKDFRQNNLAFSMSDKIVKYPTERDGNCFFHAVFGSSNPDVYQTDKAQKMRQEWHKFLSQFESLSDLKMPKLLKERLSLVFCNVFPEKGQDDLYNGDLYKKYLNEINRQDYFIYIEEVPILASLANIEIEIYYTQKLPDKIKPNPDMINADYKKNQGLWDGKLRETIYHEGFHYSRAEVTAHLQKQEHSSHYSSLSLPRCSMNELKIERASHQQKELLVSRP